jgi:hypothetical protein
MDRAIIRGVEAAVAAEAAESLGARTGAGAWEAAPQGPRLFAIRLSELVDEARARHAYFRPGPGSGEPVMARLAAAAASADGR